MKRIARISLGWICIGLGIVGVFLPILQGWFFIVTGMALLAREVRVFGRALCWLERHVGFVRRWMARRREAGGDQGDAFPPC